jgi:hypothetical protein
LQEELASHQGVSWFFFGFCHYTNMLFQHREPVVPSAPGPRPTSRLSCRPPPGIVVPRWRRLRDPRPKSIFL